MSPSATIDKGVAGCGRATRIGDTELQTWTECRIGHLLRALDQHDAANIHLHRAAALAQTIDERSAHACSLTGLAGIFVDRGALDAATTHCNQALAPAESVPDLAVVAAIRLDLADIALAAHDNAAAIANAHDALELCERIHDVSTETRAHHTLATALHADGRQDRTLPHWHTAADLYHRTGNHRRANHIQDAAHAFSAQRPALPETRTSEHPIADPAKITRHRG